jgi:hypothetical protein
MAGSEVSRDGSRLGLSFAILSLGGLALLVLPVSAQPANAPPSSIQGQTRPHLHWSDPVRYRAFSNAVRATMQWAGIEPLLINTTIRYCDDPSIIPPLVPKRRTELQRLLERRSFGDQLRWTSASSKIADALQAEFPTPVRRPYREGWGIACTAILRQAVIEVNVNEVIDETIGALKARPDEIFGVSTEAHAGSRLIALAPRVPIRLGRPLRRHSPIRVAATPAARLNQDIRDSLRRIKARIPAAPIDEVSFGAAPVDANFFILNFELGPTPGFAHFLERLAGSEGVSLHALAAADYAMPRQQTSGNKTALLARLYFSNAAWSAAIVEASGAGDIETSVCGYENWNEHFEDPEAFRQARADICILGALGGYVAQPSWKIEDVRRQLYKSVSQIYR